MSKSAAATTQIGARYIHTLLHHVPDVTSHRIYVRTVGCRPHVRTDEVGCRMAQKLDCVTNRALSC